MSLLKITGSMAQLLTRQWPLASLGTPSFLHTAAVLEAARKGTRAKAEAKKRASKKEVVKKEYIPLKKRLELKMTGGRSPRRIEDHLKYATDDVWFTKYYRWKIYSLREAIAMHRETHHETQLDVPDSYVNAHIELSMSLSKKNRYLDSFTDVVKLPHVFDSQQERNLLVISRNEETINYARQAGVGLAVGPEIIKMAQNGEVNMIEFNYIVSDLDFLPELVAIRGLMKRHFPNPKTGTAGNDLLPIIDRFMQGIEYKTNKNKYHEDYATIEVPFGRLSMTDDQLEDNLSVLLREIEAKKQKQRKTDDLISLVVLRSPPSSEQFKIDHLEYIENQALKSKVVAQ